MVRKNLYLSKNCQHPKRVVPVEEKFLFPLINTPRYVISKRNSLLYYNWWFRLGLNKVMYIASSFLLLVVWLQAFVKSVLSCSYIGCCCSDDLKA